MNLSWRVFKYSSIENFPEPQMINTTDNPKYVNAGSLILNESSVYIWKKATAIVINTGTAESLTLRPITINNPQISSAKITSDKDNRLPIFNGSAKTVTFSIKAINLLNP